MNDGRGGSGGRGKNNMPSNSPTRNESNNDTTSPAEEDIQSPSAGDTNPNDYAVDDGSANPGSTTSRDMATTSGFVPTPATTDGTCTAEQNALSSTITSSTSSAAVQSMPGAYAVPGINSTATSSSVPTTTTNEGNFLTATSSDQLVRRLSSRTRLQVLSTLLSGGAAGGRNGSNSALISSLVNSTDVVVAEATLVLDADAVRASQASPDIPIGGDVLNNSEDDEEGDDDDDDDDDVEEEEIDYIDEENGRYCSGSEETHAPGVRSVPTMATAVTAESMQGKHVLSRRGMHLAVAGVLVLLGIAVGVSVPLSRRSSGGSFTYPKEQIDLSEVLTYAPEAICYSHIPLMTDLSRVCTDPSTLPKGGPFCQLVTDGVLAQLHHIHRQQQSPGQQQAAHGGGTSNELPPLPNVDMVITNAGAQRGDILPASNVTLGIVQQNLPFLSNRIVLLDLSPFDIHRSLEGGLNYTLQTIPIKISFSAGYPYASNLRFDINLTKPYGQRVSNMELWRENDFDGDDDKETAVVDAETDGGGRQMGSGRWMLLDINDTTTKFVAATNSYLAGGGDQYFPNIADEAKTVFSDLGFTDTFSDYCRSVDLLVGPDINEMSTQNFVPLEEY